MITKRITNIVLLAVSVLFLFGCARMDMPEDIRAVAGWEGRDPNSAEVFSFVVISDRTGDRTVGEWPIAVQEINLLKPDFVVCIGDLVEGYTEDLDEVHVQWDELELMVRQFDAPFFYCPGNHDVTNDMLLEEYIRRHGVDGRTYYSFDYRNYHFIILDSYTVQHHRDYLEEQLAWFKKDVAAAKSAEHIFVFFHHPKLDMGDVGEEFWSELASVLPTERVTVFNGHTHQLGYVEEGGLKALVLGPTGAGGLDGNDLSGKYRMYAHVAVDDEGPVVSLIPLHEIRTQSYAKLVENLKALSLVAHTVGVPNAGGQVTFEVMNPIEEPIQLSVKWDAMDWKVKPEVLDLTLVPQEHYEMTFDLAPSSENLSPPTAFAYFQVPVRDSNRTETLTRQAMVNVSSTYEENLTTGKPVKVSGGTQNGHLPEHAVDGMADQWSAWWATPGPQWLEVDLEKVYRLGSVQVFPYWDGSRYYQYTVEVSTDGRNWFQVADLSGNTALATEKGELHEFEVTRARYVRVNMLKNSANQAVHLVEVRVFEAEED